MLPVCNFTVGFVGFEEGTDDSGFFWSARLPWGSGLLPLMPDNEATTGTWKLLEVPYMVSNYPTAQVRTDAQSAIRLNLWCANDCNVCIGSKWVPLNRVFVISQSLA